MKNKSSKEAHEFTELLSSSQEGQIALVKSLLDTAGIPYVGRGDSHAGIPILAIPTRISVRKVDLQKARTLLKEILR